MTPTASEPTQALVDLQRLRQVDLNLLLVLRMLLDTASVSETARRLDSTQPSISRMLERLRRELDDPLLVKSSNSMLRTARGDALRPMLDRIIELLQSVYQPHADYRLADEQRICTIGSNDSLQAALASRLLTRMEPLAPLAQLRFKPVPYPSPLRGLQDGEVDILLVMADKDEPGVRSQILIESEFTCVCATDNAAIGASTNLEAIARLPYIDVSHMGHLSAVTDRMFAAAGQRKNTVAAMSSYFAAMDVIAGSQRVCLAPAYLTSTLARVPGVRVVPLEAPFGTVTVRMVWHNTTHFDAFMATVRRLLGEIAQDVVQQVSRKQHFRIGRAPEKSRTATR